MADCPGNRMHWDVTPDFIASASDKLISESKAVYDAVGALDDSAVTYENVIKVCLPAVTVKTTIWWLFSYHNTCTSRDGYVP